MTNIFPQRVICIDTETTGLPEFAGFAQFHAPHYLEAYQGSRVIEVAWVEMHSGSFVRETDLRVRPAGEFTLDASAEQVHGISRAEILKAPNTTWNALQKLWEALVRGRSASGELPLLVGHNIFFDWHVLASESLRAGHFALFEELSKASLHCTMIDNTKRCGLTRGRGRPKWPKLNELVAHLFEGEGVEQAHSALGDARATARCFLEVCRLTIKTKPHVHTTAQSTDHNSWDSGVFKRHDNSTRHHSRAW